MSAFPSRIVSLQPSATLILEAVGELDRIVACTRYCVEVCPALGARACPVVSDSWSAQARQILDARPDLVVAAIPFQEKAVVEILKAGVRFLALAPRTLDDIYADIATVSGAVGAGERAAAVIAGMRREVDAVRLRAAGAPRPAVFCEEWGKPVIASQPWVREMVEAAGGRFVGDPGKPITPEAVLAMDPAVFIAAWCGAADRVPLEKIVAARGWHALRAVRDRRVCCIRDELLNTPAPILVHGLHALAHAIHPDRFPQVAGLRWIAPTGPPSQAEPISC